MPTHLTALAVFVLANVTASSKNASQTAASSRASSQSPTGTACSRKLVTEADAAAIFGAPVLKVEDPSPGDPQSCDFEAKGMPPLVVTVRLGQGDATVEAWLNGRVGPVPGTALQGVGERAAWVAKFHRVIATKNNLLCDISAQGIKGPPDVMQKKLAALCNKIFAAS